MGKPTLNRRVPARFTDSLSTAIMKKYFILPLALAALQILPVASVRAEKADATKNIETLGEEGVVDQVHQQRVITGNVILTQSQNKDTHELSDTILHGLGIPATSIVWYLADSPEISMPGDAQARLIDDFAFTIFGMLGFPALIMLIYSRRLRKSRG
jgi:hypothetical protein